MKALDAAQHRRRMASRKAARDRAAAGRTQERGLVIVHTGSGKGKSTAAFGMVLRCLGHGLRVGVVQFMKGSRDSGERRILEGFDDDAVTFHAFGGGFTWETQDRDADMAAAARAWEAARQMIADPAYAMVVLDELNVALSYGYLELEPVLAALGERPPHTHVVITGRGAPRELVEEADLVTEMKSLKHPFRDGVKAQPGVEY